MEVFTEALQQFFSTVLIPAIIAGGAAIIALANKYAKQYLNNLEVKHEVENMAKTTEIKNNILGEIKTIVESVVGSNMALADDFKNGSADGKLTDEQSKTIKTSVKTMVMSSLPDSLTADDGVLLKVIGGKDRLDIIIDNLIERAVYDYKIKKDAK